MGDSLCISPSALPLAYPLSVQENLGCHQTIRAICSSWKVGTHRIVRTGVAELTPSVTGKTQMPSAEGPTHPQVQAEYGGQVQAKPVIGEMAQKVSEESKGVYIGYTRPQSKQGLSGHVWGWRKALCSLACLSLELLNLHVIVWEQGGSGPACLSSLVASQFISSYLELPLFSSDLSPHSPFSNAYILIYQTAHAYFLFPNF